MFAIMRVEKRQKQAVYGLQIEANRTKEAHEKGRDFDKSNVDWERTKDNKFFKGFHCENWLETISQEISKAGAKKPRSNAVVMLDGLYTASPEWFEGKDLNSPEVRKFFSDCLKFHQAHYGTVINAVVHADEGIVNGRQTPNYHLHIASIPLVQDENGARLNAKEIMGNRQDYQRRQDEFYEQIGKPRGFERGEKSDPKHKKKHLSVQDFKKQQNEAQISAQERVLTSNKAEYTAIQEKLSESRSELDKVQEKLFDIDEKVQVKTSQWKELTQRINNALKDKKSPLYDDFVKRFFCFMSDKLVTNGREVKTVGEVFNQNYEKHLQKMGYEPIEKDDQDFDIDAFDFER